MIVKFGTSGKRVNSTLIPPVPTEINCVLKTPCSVENPVLDLTGFINTYSVAYIPKFGRYYFVTNIEPITAEITRYYLSVDVLASFKARILANTLNVVRSQSHGNANLPDPYATHTGAAPNFYTVGFDFGDNVSTVGCYILQTAGKGTTSTIGQSVNTYVISASTLKTLINKLFTASTYDDSGNVTVDATVKTYFNPFQYIISCRWFPLTGLTGTETTIKFGWWDSGITGTALTTYTEAVTATIVMPAALDWTARSPEYSRYNVAIPGIGNIEIDTVFCGYNILCTLWVDLLTGTAKCELRALGSNDAQCVIASASGYFSVEVMLTQLSADATSIASNIFNSLGITHPWTGEHWSLVDVWESSLGQREKEGSDAFSTGTLGNVATSILKKIPFVGKVFVKGLTNTLQPMLATTGAVGNMSEFKIFLRVRLYVRHYDMLENNLNSVVGTPCHRNLLLSTLSGYTECNNASIEVQGATMTEKTSIKNYLEGGFWIE